MARCLITESNLSKEMWTYAVMCSVYIRNRCYNSSLGKTPYEPLTGIKPKLGGMPIFGCVCYAHVQNPKKQPDFRSEKGVFVSYDKGSPAYLVYFPDKKIKIKVRCVKFIDTVDVKYDVRDEYESDDCCDIKQRYNVDPVLNEPVNDDTVNNDDPVNDDTINNDEPVNVDAKNDAETVD